MPTTLTRNESEIWLQSADFDDLLMTGETAAPNGARYSVNVLDADLDWGEPVPVDVQVQRWMTEGAVAATQGHEDREITFNVQVEALTSRDLAAAETALVRRSMRPCSLKWIPPEGEPDAPATLFEVWTWHLAHNFDGMAEKWLQRIYTVTMTAKPWVRSNDLTIVDALTTGVTPTTTTVDDCTSTTNWSGSPNNPTVVGGTSVQESRSVTLAPVVTSVSLTRTGLVTGLGTTPYLMLDLALVGSTPSLVVTVDGATLTRVAQIGSVGYYKVPAGVTSFTTLKVTATFRVSTPSTTVSLTIADVSKTDTVGGVGSKKQLTRSLTVGGAVPTSGSIQVASPSATPLGTVLVYTFPDNGLGYTTGLRKYRTAGATPAADASAVSGFRDNLVVSGVPAGLGTRYTIPASVLPEGTYTIIARLFSTAATTAFIGAAANTGAFTVNAAGKNVTWDTPNTYKWVVLSAVPFPTLALPEGSAVTSFINLVGTGGSGTISVDETYLLDTTRGAVSLVDCGAATRLWIDAPDANPRNLPSIFVGTAADRSDAAGAIGTSVLSKGDHDLDPRGAVLFTVTDGVNDAVVSASFYKRWHTHAGE